jgi:tetratricopeptide (TPR) repeat protein
VSPQYTPNLLAYDAFLKARHFLQKVTPEAMSLCKDYCEQAIALDPGFGRAYVALGDCLMILAWFFPAREIIPKIRDAAVRALEIDSSLQEAHGLLGCVAAVFDYNWTETERRFQLARTRHPVPSQVRLWYAYFYLQVVGRAREAVTETQLVVNEDPLNVFWRECLGECLLAAGRDSEAEAEFRTALELDENFWLPPFFLAIMYALRGSISEAVMFAEKAHAVLPFSETAGLLSGLLRRAGNTSRSEELFRSIGNQDSYTAPVGFAWYHLACLEIEKAAHWLEKAIPYRYPEVIFDNLYLSYFNKGRPWTPLARKLNMPERT